jgi:hypothetical protein
MLTKVRLTITAIFCASIAFAQSGAIKVHMFDAATKQPLPFSNVVVQQKGTQVSGGVTDIDGYVTIKPLDPGEYEVKAISEGYQDKEITGVNVAPDKTNYLELDMGSTVTKLTEVIIIKEKTPILPPNTQQGQTVTKEDYQHMAVKDVNSVAAGTAGIYQADVGGALSVRGARNDATQYIVDGIKMNVTDINGNQVTGGIPQSMVDQITTITGGIPAKYGDATGGIVEINTLNASPKFFGSVSGITSELLDPWGYNDVNFSVGGPLWSKKDTATHTKKILIDFILGGEVEFDKDNSPSFVNGYQVNPTELAYLQQNPFTVNPAGGFNRTAEYVTANEINQTAAMPNLPQVSISLSGKLGFTITPNVKLVAGGSYQYINKLDMPSQNVYELFNSAENPLDITNTYNMFVRLTQRFPTPESKDKDAIVKNAYYSLQAEYGNTYEVIENNQFKDNFFDYGYIGQFYEYRGRQYTLGPGPFGQAYYQTGFTDSLLTFKPGTQNPLEANYTSQLYQLLGPQNVTSGPIIQENQGLLNGDRPNNVYSLWYNTGRAYPGYEKINNTHFRFSANFSADIKNNAVQLGFEYEQNTQSVYSLGAASLWTIMRQNSNLQLQQLNTSDPMLAQIGQNNYYAYNLQYNGAQQSQFDKSLRQKLGLAVNSTDFIQPDNYAPSMYSLSMFSASDLLNNGNQLVSYYGYDYAGNQLSSNTSIDDFFNKKDANGNNYYPIAPYNPIYIAGYIQDHFDIKNMKFDVGIRVDDFDANQPVLKDPYLFFPAKTVGELGSTQFAGQEIPSGMGSNYVVYVNNSQSPTAIVGYRNGNNWYNAGGNLVTDPTVISSATTTGSIQPFLENPSQTTLSSNAFTTYTPQINVMPRVAFAFPISDVANFFAHYDVLTQRPPAYGVFNPDLFLPTQYMFIQSQINGIINNPNLLPQQTVEYELGYSQVLDEARTSALTLSAFYRENKSEIDAYRYLNAYPTTYTAFANIDFGTTKGLSISYDLRRVNNIKFRASYTLQFADGTGSGPESGVNLANSGSPNLQIPQALNNDQRNTFLINIDYHYSAGQNYNGPVFTTKSGKAIQILANAGINLNFEAGSGTPYTVQGNATEGNGNGGNVAIGIANHYSLVGSINGAYLPWQYRVDMRADKEFPIVISPSKGDNARHCSLLVYLAITNLLNTENVKNVYAFTGSPTDDGYLASAQGQQSIPGQTSPQAFQDQYKIKELDPTFFALPREIHLGVDFNF